MANLSDCSGTMIIDGKFYNQHHSLIIQALNDLDKMCVTYGFQDIETYAVDKNDEDDIEIDFDATGRWSMEETLPELFQERWYSLDSDHASEEERNKHHALITFFELLKNTDEPVITLDYVDTDPATEFICHETAEYTNGLPELTFEEDYDYTVENVIRYVWREEPEMYLVAIDNVEDLDEWFEKNGDNELSNAYFELTNTQKEKVIDGIKDSYYLNGFVCNEDSSALWEIEDLVEE